MKTTKARTAMTSDVKAALERVRRIHAGESVLKVYDFVPCGECTGIPIEWANKWREDCEEVEAFCLAEFPASDDEPITEDWLASVGLDDVHDCMAIRGHDTCVAFLKSVGKVFVQGSRVNTVVTRGQFRKLCAALVIPLKEQPQ